jgi:hypothetical protein
MKKLATVVAATAVTLMAAVAAMPATVAGAVGPPSVAWVSHAAILYPAGGTNCARPGYNSIQSAIDNTASGATIHVCAGVPYVEQLQITQPVTIVGAGEATTTIALPSSPANSTTACDAAVTTAYGAPQDEISICGAGAVSISGLTVQPQWAAGTCNDNLYGILVGGESHLTATKVALDGGGAFPANGCQGGVAIQVGMAGLSGTYGVGTATLNKDSVTNYQKNGITVDGAGSSAVIEHTSVTTAPNATTAQNGIQVSSGAKGVISNSTVSGDECNLPTVCGINATWAGGVLFYDSGPGSSLTGSTVSNSDYGFYYVSGAANEAASAPTTVTANHFTGDRYAGITLDQGTATLSHDTVTASLVADPGDIGVIVYQYGGQSYASQATASHMNISGESVAVDVNTDGGTPGSAPGDDLPGTFTITHSSEVGNTLPTTDTSPNFLIVALHDIY